MENQIIENKPITEKPADNSATLNFMDLGLPKSLIESLNAMGFKNPTPIQEKAIPAALQGADILGSAQTGTGKTAAFAIPMINKILRDVKSTALILTPTRELATQVYEAVRLMTARNCEAKSALLIGGESIGKQLRQLSARPRIIIGTPGRVYDHFMRRSLRLDQVGFFVLDETDRMLDMGFDVQIEQIAKHLPQNRQTLLFSATMPKNIMSLASRYLNNPIKIEAGVVNQAAKNIDHQVYKVDEANKFFALTDQLSKREGSVIVFVKTKFGADKLARKLRDQNHKADAIHCYLKQRQRDRVISDFRDSKYRILVATDVASRGLDIPHIKHVLNYDLPQKAEDYIHRIGRTARAGEKGEAASFIVPADSRMWREINQLLHPDLKQDLGRDEFPQNKVFKKRRFGNGGGGNRGRFGGGRDRRAA